MNTHEAVSAQPAPMLKPAQKPVPGLLPQRNAAALPSVVQEVLRSPGQPLGESIRGFMEPRFGHSFSAVRVHTDTKAAESARELNARAYTVGENLVFGAGQYNPGTNEGEQLLAHELAHVVQQSGQTALQMDSLQPGGSTYEREARESALALQRGEPVLVRDRTSRRRLQASLLGDIVDGVADFGENRIWDLLNEVMPEVTPTLRELINKGPVLWLKDKITSAVDGLFNTLLSPLREQSGSLAELQGHFTNLMAWMRDAAVKISKGDCSSLTEAAQKIQEVIEGLAAPIVETIKQKITRVKFFFNDLWEQFGAPAWDFLKRAGGAAWEKIQQLGTWLWDKTATIREKSVALFNRVWTWIKNKLGIGEGPEGQDGLWQWIKNKVQLAWDNHIKPFVDKYKKPLMVVGGVLAMLSPAGPFIAIGAAVAGLIMGVRWIRQNMSGPNGVVNGREMLQKTILPAILGAIKSVSPVLGEKVQFITGKLGEVLGGLGQALSAVGESIFRFAVDAVKWVMGRFTELVNWAKDKLTVLVDGLVAGLAKLQTWLQPVFDVLKPIGEALVDILKLPVLVLGELWKIIPACIRDPFVNFFVNIVLKRVKIFQQISALAEVWAKIKDTALTIIHKIFKDGDLKGALLIVLRLVLDALGVPLELITGIFTKGQAAIQLIMDDPIGFLRNALAAMAKGFSTFFDNIGTHLLNGVMGWLFSAVSQAGLKPPARPITFSSILEFILQVLDITVDRILDRLEEKIGAEKFAPIRKAIGTLSKIWDWFNTMFEEGPGGVWKKLESQLGDLWAGLIGGMVDWIIKKITAVAMPKLMAMLAGGPVGAIINGLIAIYKAAQSFAKELKRILEIVTAVLDGATEIAKGNLATAVTFILKALDRALSVAIGFLANQLSLGDLGEHIKEMVDFIREKVNLAIDFVIDKVVAIVKGLVGLVKNIASKVAAWWKEPVKFKTKEGEDHSIFIQGEPPNAVIVVKSDEKYFSELIGKIKDKENKKAALKTRQEITDIIKLGARTENVREAKNEKEFTTAANENANNLQVKLTTLADILINEDLIKKEAVPPTPTYSYKVDKDGRAVKAKVKKLSAMRPMGSSSSEANGQEPHGFEFARAIGSVGGEPYFRRLHLINFRFGGPGTKTNLAVATNTDNSHHQHDVEDKIKLRVGEKPDQKGFNSVMTYTVTAVYDRSDKALKYKEQKTNLKYFPTAFICSWKFDKSWQKARNDKEADKDETDKTVRVDFEDSWEDHILKKYGV